MKRLMALIAGLFAGPATAQSLPEILTALDAQLLQKRPDFAAQLRPPLTPAGIAALEEKYGLTLPEDVKVLYLWHDGQDPASYDSFAGNFMFRSLAEVLGEKEELDSTIGYDFALNNWWHPAWLPLFHNGGGDSIVVDLEGVHTGAAGQMLTFYHDWELRPIEAASLTDYMQAVLSYYQSTPADEMEEPFSLEAHLPETGRSFKASGQATPLK